MKKELLILLMLLIVFTAFSQNYRTECRAYKPKGQQKFGKIVDITVPVYIGQTYIRIGNNTYKFWTTGGKTIVNSGDVAYTYLAVDNTDNSTVEIQINYIQETGNARLIYIRYFERGEYCYILQ